MAENTSTGTGTGSTTAGSKSIDVLNVQSTGDVQISANAAVNVEGESVTISTPGYMQTTKERADSAGKISLMNTDEIILQAGKSIKLVVGNNVIMLNHDGIIMQGNGVFSTNGPLSSMLSLNPYTGVIINGTKCTMTGTLSTKLIDGMGNVLQLGPSGISLSGLSVVLDVLTKAGTLAVSGITTVRLLSQIITSIIASTKGAQSSGGKAASNVNTTISQAVSVIAAGMSFTQMDNAYNLMKADQNGRSADCVLASTILDFISTLLMVLATTASTWGGEWVDKKINESEITIGDCLKIIAVTCSFVACLLIYIPMLIGFSPAATRVQLKAGSLQEIANQKSTVAHQVKENIAALLPKGSKSHPEKNEVAIQTSQSNINNINNITL